MKRIIMIIIMITMSARIMTAQTKGTKSASSSICVKIIFPHNDSKRTTTNFGVSKSIDSKRIVQNIEDNYLYIISRNNKKYKYKLNGKIDFNNFVTIINAIKDTLPSGDYIATCNINSSPVSYRFKIPS
ncbi:hypothetical protein J7J58_06510 [candidate division WOR-3 bacterium]|nr:hypothetical protein [candidate division WOR-3 bacterium]